MSQSEQDDGEVISLADAVRTSEHSFSDGIDVYSDEDGSRTASDPDAEGLFESPTVDQLRWFYGETAWAPTIVDKPVDDAFKHGYEIEDQNNGVVEDFLERYIPYLKSARKKARRDGNAFIFWNVRDANTVERPIENPRGVEAFHVLDIGDLSDSASPTRIEEYVEYDHTQLTVTDDGMVFVDDIRSTDHEDFVGVVYEKADTETTTGTQPLTFIHHERLHPFAERTETDGSLDDNTFPMEGESILTAVYHPLVQLEKATWSLGQALFRYAGPLHVIEIDSDIVGQIDQEEHVEELQENLDNLNSASEVVLPPGHELDVASTEGQLDPENYVDPLISAICAGSEMTRSVLLGTQTGTVSGSETDIKNYFNQVERDRQQVYEVDMEEGFDMYRNATDDVAANLDANFTVDWEPIFKLSALDDAERLSRIMQTVSAAVNDFVLTPQEARTILQEEWADVEIDWQQDFSETEREWLKTLNIAQMGTEAALPDGEEMEGNPRVGNTNREGEGGMKQGQTTESENPATDATGVTDD